MPLPRISTAKSLWLGNGLAGGWRALSGWLRLSRDLSDSRLRPATSATSMRAGSRYSILGRRLRSKTADAPRSVRCAAAGIDWCNFRIKPREETMGKKIAIVGVGAVGGYTGA